jgi:hypothetical protein
LFRNHSYSFGTSSPILNTIEKINVTVGSHGTTADARIALRMFELYRHSASDSLRYINGREKIPCPFCPNFEQQDKQWAAQAQTRRAQHLVKRCASCGGLAVTVAHIDLFHPHRFRRSDFRSYTRQPRKYSASARERNQETSFTRQHR